MVQSEHQGACGGEMGADQRLEHLYPFQGGLIKCGSHLNEKEKKISLL